MHSKPVRPAKVKFFLRKKQPTDHALESVNISLAQKDIRGALQSILSSCSLSTEYVDNLPKTVPIKPKILFRGEKMIFSAAIETAFWNIVDRKTVSYKFNRLSTETDTKKSPHLMSKKELGYIDET